jgi:hypothetical protein
LDSSSKDLTSTKSIPRIINSWNLINSQNDAKMTRNQ